MNRKSCPECIQTVAPWMVTFADMVTLLMVFFLMLMSAGEIKIVKTLIILSAFEGKLGILSGGQSLSPGEFENMGQNIQSLPSPKKNKSLAEARRKAVSVLQAEIKTKKIRVTEDERGITVSLMTDLLFGPGSDQLNMEQTRSLLENLRLLIDSDTFDSHIKIEGHTDKQQYQGLDFKDNWDLSVKRAWSILNGLRIIPSLTELDESKISIHGYGDTRPVESNDTPEGRQYNRRVDIMLLWKDGQP